MLESVLADLDRLPSISQPVDLIEDDAIVLVALGHVCACGEVDVLPKLLQNDLQAHTTSKLHQQRQCLTQARLVLDIVVSSGL